MKNPARMWPYWRDKKGLREAIEDYYPEMKGDPRIVAALDQIENGIRAIDSIMKDREDTEDALDGDSDERF